MSNDQQQIARAAKIKELLGDPLNQTWDPLFVILENVHAKFDQLPPPLLWIEPSVNMPHLQACLSYVLGAPLGSILITGVLLEHVLRMAVIDRVLGYQGGLDETHWQKYKWYNVGNFLDGGPRSAPDDNLLKIVASIIAVEDQQWWRDAAKQIRDKATHFDAPEMIAHLGGSKQYMGIYTAGNAVTENALCARQTWGFIFHREDELVAKTLLTESTEKIGRVAEVMKWSPDCSSWISQKSEYDSFFRYRWNAQAMQETFARLSKSINFW